MKNHKPLEGYRVVELATYMAAPSCARLLADWGADVIKVEANAGEPFRYYGPTMKTPVEKDECPNWDLYNAGKRSLTLNIKSAEGKKILFELLETADVFITNNRPQSLERNGLDYDSLKDTYPRLVYASVNGYGEKGPDAHLPGFDVSAFWARSGFLVDLVKPDEYPIYSPAGMGDLTVGMAMAAGIVTALLAREKTGKGDKILVPLYGAAIWYLSMVITSTQKKYGNVYPKTRAEGNPTAIPYKTKDNEWLMLSMLNYNEQWPSFCKAIEREDLAADERFKDIKAVLENNETLVRIMEDIFKERDYDDWHARLMEINVPHNRLCHFSEVTTDPQAWENGFLQEVTFRNGEKGVLPRPPVHSNAIGLCPYNPGPLLGEHVEDLLKELKYSEEQIKELKDKKVV